MWLPISRVAIIIASPGLLGMGKWRKAHALKDRVRFEIKVGADRLGILRATGPNCQSA